MHFLDGLKSAINSIFSHKLRSALTITGIVIGVLAVIIIFSSIYGIKNLISDAMAGGSWHQSIEIYPGSGFRYGRADASSGSTARKVQSVMPLNLDDYFALKENLDYKNIYSSIRSAEKMRMGNVENSISIIATENSYFKVKDYELSSGSLFTKIQQAEAQAVAIVGYKFAREYYANEDPIGKTLILGKQRFRIVGVLGKEPETKEKKLVNIQFWVNESDFQAVFVPLKYGAYYLRANKAIDMIYLQAHNDAEYARMKTQARQLLLSRHNMYPNFNFAEMGSFFLQMNKEFDEQMKKWNITLSAIASISLLVGGVGLFSTLLISIQERMTEIGVRKSIGATEQDIFFYFIMESLSLALLASLLGWALAWSMVSIATMVLHFSFVLPWQGIVLALSFSLIIGFVSGLYPALKASRIDPIKAIFYRD